ncbi:glutathione hydrolase 1 proenzyme-like isoform X2 [Spodoptera litura]|uniref:Glutathione hydrolase 1 proenzyme-like isoform X2 n=1 Tax=Spodoptera litura TaxID=69820 RepID=A0A9J7J588_SPOLT|nr:glutathione hydrolase 1 proenzyme-like isoform X2 [Spodoptera litura]XP_022837988.1 glutathione hydrolase 1 proenzyme-like isoform X2 [Spodoptera litura]
MSDKLLLRQSSLKKPGKPNVRRKKQHVLIRLPDSDPDRPYKLKTKIVLAALAVLVFISALSGYLIGSADYASRRAAEPPDPVAPLKPSASRLHVFQKAAVCTDAPQCSQIGREILIKNGSAVDAAVAAMFCNGLLNHQSMGLGGGFFMTVYLKDEERAYTVNAREMAPGAATVDMFNGSWDKAAKGPLSIGVPGELRGMWAAHKRWGKLSWENLVAPSLDLCRNGFAMSKVMYDGLESAPYIKNDPHLRKMYFNTAKGQFHKPGTIIKPSEALCNTYQRIAENGGDDLYNGTLAADLLDDLERVGSIITADDLRQYEAKISEPIAVPLSNGDTFYSPPPPSSGAILVNILNILSGYNFTAASINTTEDKILTYHRIIEAFKYAYATRTKLGDSDFLDLSELIRNVTTPEYGTEIRLRINDTSTSNDTATYGAETYNQPDAGTAHISIIAGNGDAVSVTSSINFYYGAGFSTLKTGIVMNNVMDDFSSPGITNYFGLKPSPANFIAPHKRPMSSMSPSIIVDRNGNAKLVIGASGGTKITTAVALVTIRKLWFDQSIKEAVDEARIHHQITPMHVEYEFGVTEDIVQGLRAKGHGMVRYRSRGSIICALYRNRTAIYANADFRKGGDVAGMD